MKAPKSEIPSLAFQSGENSHFVGAKVALLVGGQVVSLLRDDRDDIVWPAHWDVLGGKREGQESAWDCAQREAHEESGLRLERSDLCWGRRYVNSRGQQVWFFVAQVEEALGKQVYLAAEGQDICLMAVDGYLRHPKGVPQFQARLADWIAGL